MAVLSNCTYNNCYGAFVATRAYGLYYTNTLVFDDHSDPEWERLGQTLAIKQFHWDTSSPERVQVCLDFGGNGWIRRPAYYGDDDWHQIFTPTSLATATGLVSVTPTWIEYNPNGNIYVATNSTWDEKFSGVAIVNFGYGAGPWHARLVCKYSGFGPNKFKGSGSIHHQNKTAQNPYGAGIWWYGLHWYVSKRSAAMYSLDEGNTWGPIDTLGNPKPIYYGDGGSGPTEVVPSEKYWDRAYFGHSVGGGVFGLSSIAIEETSDPTTYDKSGTFWPGTLAQVPGAIWQNKYNGNQMFVSHSDGNIYFADNFEGSGPYATPDLVPNWDVISYPKRSLVENPGFRISAMDGTYINYMLFGHANSRLYATGYGGHIVASTIDEFGDVYLKGGVNRGVESPISGAIYYRCGGVAKQGIVVFDVEDPVPSDEPPTTSGWPIFINCEARELVPDPAGDRLYVTAETIWPEGDDLFNQPMMFQFVLSGDMYGTYRENQGFLAFLPFVALGGNIYSGSYTYDGALEAHTGAPTYHNTIFAGRFATNKQIYYNADMTALTDWVLSGWPQAGWELVGEFDSERISSVANNYEIEEDLTVSHSESILWPTEIDTAPWTWVEVIAQPFTNGIQTQFREGFNLWAGAEGLTGSVQPVRLVNITMSGEGWYLRGAGLPEDVQINEIERGE